MQTRRMFLATLAGASAFALAACGGNGGGSDAAPGDANEASGLNAENKSKGCLSYDEYVAADIDSTVIVECFVQAKQSWWEDNGEGKATIYAADEDGAYFIYDCPCTKEDYDKLTEGAKITVTGFKSEWEGEVEITEAGLGFSESGTTYIAEPVDVTDKLGADELIDFQNQKVSFTGLTIAPSTDPDGKEVAFLYNYDGSGAAGDDLYFNVTDGKGTYSFTVESYLTGEDTDVYKTVSNDLKVGDTVDLEGFLYWYQGANPHITKVTIK